MYCVAVLDAYSRRIVGWSIDNNMRATLVVDTLGMAITRRQPTGIRRYCTLITVLHLRPGRPAKEDGKTGYTGEGDQVIAR